MTLQAMDDRQHAQRVQQVVQHGMRDLASEVVAHSWERCVRDHKLDPDLHKLPSRLGRSEFDARRDAMADVIECARYEMSTLYQQLGDPESAVVLTDAQGVVLNMLSSPEFERRVKPLGLEVGAVWSEAEAGTNGMGTCAVAARPVSICRDDHFLTQYTTLTCSAVPIYDPSGEMTAVLDVSSRSTMPQQHLLVLLGMTARMIENRLIDMRFPDAHPVLFHSRPEFVYTLHEGKLIVDGDGRVLAANRSALFQLGLETVGDIRARKLEQIFQTTLPSILERSNRASYHPVVTYRTDAAHRFFAVAREPARGEASPLQRRDFGIPVGAARPRLPQASRGAVATTSPVRGGPGLAAGAAGGEAAAFGDPRLRQHLATAQRLIARGTPLLLRGETGAGKEVFARAVHQGSPRAEGSFVAVNCASLPEHLIEAELFGYRAGAFTGAERQGRRGRIAQADGGTLFLDEIGDMPLALQPRLLRVLDERMITPLGTDEPRPVEFQLISASHRHLEEMVAEGTFREDLYFRLAGIELDLPALRERSDRADLIRQVLGDEGGDDHGITPAAWDLLMTHPWPGNVRQLRYVLRTAVALAGDEPLTPAHLPSLQRAGVRRPAASAPVTLAPASDPAAAMADSAVTLPPEQLQERLELVQQLEAMRWNVSHVAKALGVSRNTLYRRMHRLCIPVTHGE